ncbi:hypothetical protein JJE63_01045 [Alloprevotella tannerae]|uniref:hypothetical protein n=1 Tax=Alloprevotella tannerae TaxID=76122 RepID=UPI001EDA4D81|nr:hypothetical protein [Alloprevotella tannerae]MCG2651922.1 hypothetical protein [Alloprevotella tannerae]
MRKIDQPANCVGVVTVKWTVQNDGMKTVYSQEVGFASAWMNKEALKKLKEEVQTQVRKFVEKNKYSFDITESSIIRYSSSVKMIGCDIVLRNKAEE